MRRAQRPRPFWRRASCAIYDGFAPSSDGHDRGITLIEVLVVVAVLSVLAVGVALPMRGGSEGASADATLLQGLYQQIRGLAVHGRAQRGLVVDPKGVRVVVRDAAGWQPSKQLIRWQGRAQFVPLGAGLSQSTANMPDVLFLPNGQTSAFQVRLVGRRGASVVCESDGWTELSCEKK